MVFSSLIEPVEVVFRRCAEDLLLWKHRCAKQAHIDLIQGWAVTLTQLASPP
jgi:hypothetical protein